MDDIGLHPAFSEPARQPEAVTPGLIGNDNALKRPTRFCGLVPPTLQKPEQRVPIRLKFLQRLAVNPGHDPRHEPACLAHLDHHNQGAILLKGSEGSAQVVRLWHGGTSSVLSSDDRASPLAAPHSISSRLRVPLAIITGGMDAIVDARDHSCQLHQQAPESTLTILPGQGHMIHYSARAEIGRAVDGLMGLAMTGSARPTRGLPFRKFGSALRF